MDGDEVLVLVIAFAVTVAWTVRGAASLARLGPPERVELPLAITPLACLAGLWWVLRHAADPQVRGHGEYLSLFMAVGGAALATTTTALPVVLGVSVRDDAVERRNVPAAVVACGAMVATMAVYAGANVGTGATIWTTLGPAAVAITSLAALAIAHAAAAGLTEAVTVDRDPAAAVRAVGLHGAMAVVLARAVAGDFVSIHATIADLARRGWPAVALAAVAVAVDRAVGRQSWTTRRRPWPAVITAAAYVVAASTWAMLTV